MPVTDIDPDDRHGQRRCVPQRDHRARPEHRPTISNGIPDAIITISPRSALNLATGVDTITITGQTLATSPLPNYTWTGTATVTVTGGSVTPVIAAAAGVPTGPVLETTFVSPFGANQYTPSLTALSAFNYQPIPSARGAPAVPAAARASASGSTRSTTPARRSART